MLYIIQLQIQCCVIYIISPPISDNIIQYKVQLYCCMSFVSIYKSQAKYWVVWRYCWPCVILSVSCLGGLPPNWAYFISLGRYMPDSLNTHRWMTNEGQVQLIRSRQVIMKAGITHKGRKWSVWNERKVTIKQKMYDKEQKHDKDRTGVRDEMSQQQDGKYLGKDFSF